MGKYHQWLHYRTVDQQLHAQQEQCERELVNLRQQADLFKDNASAPDNVIIQALARQHRSTSQVQVSSAFAQSPENVRSAATVWGSGLVDQQSVRTNHLVQRWMERWGRHPPPMQEDGQAIFAQLGPQDVEQFYQSYQYWQLQQRITQVQTQMTVVQQQVRENTERMEQVYPGAVALATLARLQASGVNDVDLLDRMLERGEAWLDHSMQLLEQCEHLNVIDGDYTHWCELALEGAYDWVASMLAANSSAHVAPQPTESPDEVTEEMLLQKLMSDDELEQLPIVTDSTPVLAIIPVEETTESGEVELPSTGEPAPTKASTPTEEIAKSPIGEPAPIEEAGEQEMSGNIAAQASSSLDEVPPQEHEVSIPETPRPAILETEPGESETEEDLVIVSQATTRDVDESIHAVEEIMYFTDEASWQWEEPVSSETHIPAMPDAREEQRTQDVQSVKRGFFHRFFKKREAKNG